MRRRGRRGGGGGRGGENWRDGQWRGGVGEGATAVSLPEAPNFALGCGFLGCRGGQGGGLCGILEGSARPHYSKESCVTI